MTSSGSRRAWGVESPEADLASIRDPWHKIGLALDRPPKQRETTMNALLMILMFLMAVFLILLVLIQRGRGGGLAGAFGGMGGQSAFGTKAGDVFTKVTIGVAAVWILLCVFGNWWNIHSGDRFSAGEAAPSDYDRGSAGPWRSGDGTCGNVSGRLRPRAGEAAIGTPPAAGEASLHATAATRDRNSCG